MDAMKVTAELEERLARYPADRYPVQHATAQFHLGVALLNAERLEPAQAALATAAQLLDPKALPVEHAKATNALGAALRLGGRTHEAAGAFRRAAATFESADEALDQGAALFNLGLVQREADEAEDALGSLSRARDLLDPKRVPKQASAAAREHGATLLELGRPEAAADALEGAMALAERFSDQAGLGAAANILGLARLAGGRVQAAVEALRAAAGAHPRTVRPADHAMAKANLALAYERTPDAARARLNARQALAVRQAPTAVVEQARAVVERLGSDPGDLVTILDDEPPDRWPALIREDVARWVDASPGERRAEAAAWIDGELARPGQGPQLAEAMLDTILELPPAAMDAVIRSLLEALGSSDPEAARRFRSEAWRAMAAFQVPQERRLRDRFDRIAVDLGQEPVWS